jgi:hypothetical protein
MDGGWPKTADYAFGSNPPYELYDNYRRALAGDVSRH